MAAYVLAVDQGTTSTRAILFRPDLTAVAASARELTRFFRPPAGSSTIRRRSGRACSKPRVPCCGRPASQRPRSRRSASPTSAKPSSSGTGRPAGRSTMPSSGRTAAAPISAAGSTKQATSRCSRAAPGCCSTLISRRPSSPGCSTTSRAPASAPGAANSPSARSIRSCSGVSPAGACTRPMRPMPRARSLYDIHRGQWDDELLDLLNIPAALLPQVQDCSGDFGVAEASAFRRADRHRRRRRRPAGGDDRPGLFRAGNGESDLRHRLFPARQYRREPGRLQAPAADDDRLSDRRPPHLCAGRFDLHRRRRACNGCATGSA